MEDNGTAEHSDTAHLAFVGDLMLSRKINVELINGRSPEAFWGDVRPGLLALDGVIGNLETALTARKERWPGKAFNFCADPRAVSISEAGNVKCVNLANNHSLDGGRSGLLEMIKKLDAAGIAHAGAGATLSAAISPAVFRCGGLIVGVVSMTNTLRAFRAGPDAPGTSYLQLHGDPVTAALMATLVAKLSELSADLKVLSVHWGPNLRPWPPRRYRAFARQAIDAGFDIVHGHSAHILQPLEYYRDGIILYDTGDFLDDYWVFPGVRIDRSFLFLVEAARNEPPRLTLQPVLISNRTVNFAIGAEGEAIRTLNGAALPRV